MSFDKAAYNRAYMQRRRLERKLAQRCIDCNAELGERDAQRCRGCLAKIPDHEWTREDTDRKRQERLAREAKGQCSWCTDPATNGKLCYGHRLKANAATRQRRAKLRAEEPTSIAPSPRLRILRAVSRLEWPTSRDLGEAIGLPEDGHDPERNAAMQMLSRLVRAGLIEARGTHGSRRYAITATGREALHGVARDDHDEAPITTATTMRRAA